ncbi:unnamed protein product [Phytophthora lilii]|uniref:Unnamed protein product n=1 Tax=Phytophthora lilii TaxID=2077276 RepID=A0A9W6TXT6_9STRA|nr:unnamed protein product [Phytophthora lilii]
MRQSNFLTKTDVQDDDDDEDRAFNLRLPTWFRLWRLRQVAGKVKTTDVISAKESAWIDRWVAKDLSPDYLYKMLGLAKQGDKAMQSQNYRLFEEYNNRLFAKDQALYQSWMEKLMTPEDVYKALKLDKLKGAKVAKSKNYRRYEVYLVKYYETNNSKYSLFLVTFGLALLGTVNTVTEPTVVLVANALGAIPNLLELFEKKNCSYAVDIEVAPPRQLQGAKEMNTGKRKEEIHSKRNTTLLLMQTMMVLNEGSSCYLLNRGIRCFGVGMIQNTCKIKVITIRHASVGITVD